MRLIRLLAFLACAAALSAAVADLASRLSQWQHVPMALNAPSGDPRQQQLIGKLIQASQQLENIYWRQSDPAGLQLLINTKDRNLRRLLMINGGRWDLIDENRPFVGNQPAPPGRSLYPTGLTREQIEQYVKAHPAQKAALYSPYTVIVPYGKEWQAIPYHVIYGPWLQAAANRLREAAALSSDPEFTKFLALRADALLSDDYYPSDLAWLDLKKPQIDIIFAPYETYLDGVLGVKTSYEAAVLIRNEPESSRLDLYQKYVPEMQDALPIDRHDLPSKQGQPTPMEVVDAPYRTGDLLHGYQAVADNLPNDARIHEAKGTKKIFFKNFMDARVKYVVLPVANQIMLPAQAASASAEGYLAAVVLHEISHGLGPSYSRSNGAKKDIREAIGPAYAALEESKADVVGMYCLNWLMKRGALPSARAHEYYASYVGGIFRSVRYGVAEPHGRGEMMEFNYLASQHAINEQNGKYAIDYERIPAALSSLAKQLLTIEATGDRSRAENWFNRYDKMPPALETALQAVKGVPVDIEPQFAIPVIPR